jgi:predicted nucleotidyltransferase
MATVEANKFPVAFVVDAIASVLEPNPNVVAAYLYGSSVRADAGPDSDVDVLVVVEDTVPLRAIRTIARQVSAIVHGIDITVLRRSEINEGTHPGWSHHYYTNVHRGGIHICGYDIVAVPAGIPVTFEGVLRRVVQLCQRARLVILNEAKADEATFWCTKYQHWVPLCLLEILELAGVPKVELHRAHADFEARFEGAPTMPHPYTDLESVGEFLEALAAWLRANRGGLERRV